MKRFVVAMALTCVLSGFASAGDVPSVGITAPTPQGVMGSTSPGDIPSVPGEVPTVGYAQHFSDAALDLFEVMLGWSSF